MSNGLHESVLKRRALTAIAWALGLVMFFPFIWLLLTALKETQEVFRVPPSILPDQFLWRNFAMGWNLIRGKPLANSIWFSAIVTLGQLMVCAFSGFAFSRIPSGWQRWFYAVVLSTMMIPPQVTMVPMFIMLGRLGWINSYQGLILPVLAQTGFGTFIFTQFMKGIPHDLTEAAIIDGAGWPRVFGSVVLPLSRPVMATYLAVTFLTSWNMYLWPLVISQTPDMWVLTIRLASMIGTGSTTAWNVAMAANFLAALPVVIAFLGAQKFFVQGIATTGLRE